MTTIAYRWGVLAADSRETNQNTIVDDECEKLITFEAFGLQHILAGTGAMPLVQIIMRDIQRSLEASGGGKPFFPPDLTYEHPLIEDHRATVILLTSRPEPTPNGISYLPISLAEYCRGYLSPIRRDIEQPWAWGSGMDFALGAMKAGADARNAVSIAAALDTGTGGKVQSN